MLPPPPRSTLFPYTTLFRSSVDEADVGQVRQGVTATFSVDAFPGDTFTGAVTPCRSEEHTSELQSRLHLVCRLLLEKKKKNKQIQEPFVLRPPPARLPRYRL